MAPPKYVVNNDLTPEATMTVDLMKKCTFTVGPPVAINIKDDDTKRRSNAPKRQYWHKFTEVSYPNGEKSGSMIIPDCVMHHEIHDFYGTPSIFLGVPQSWVRPMELKIAASGFHGKFEDKKIMSDAKYWWIRCSFKEALEDQEYIRMDVGDDEPDYYPSFADFFADYPTSVVANVTCTLKFKCDTDLDKSPNGSEEWRATLAVSMFTPYDKIEVSPPSIGTKQRSIMGQKDKARPGLLSMKRNAN